MNKKRFTSLLIITSMLAGNLYMAPVVNAKSQKTIKTQITEYKFDYINMDWWNSFQDEYLSQYVADAVKNNQDLKIATLRVEQFHQMTKLQFAKELPQVSVGFAPTGMKLPGVTNTSGMWAFPITVNYELDLFLKNRDKTRSAKKDWEKSQIEERASYIAIASAVGSTYFNIIKADKLIELQKEIIKDRKEIYELMNERNKVGLTSTADVVKANKAYIASNAELLDLEKYRNVLLNSLAVLIGESPANSTELKRKEYDESYLVKVPESIPSEIIVQRPDYLAAVKMVEKADLDVKTAKKEFLPSINLFGLMAFGASSLSNAFSWSSTVGLLSANAMLDLFAGGRKISTLKLRKNYYKQVLENYIKTNLIAIQEVNDALVSLKQDDKKYKTNLEVYNLEEKDFEYTQHKYDEGLISYLDLLQRRENLLSLNKLVVQNKLDCNIDYVGLYKATGSKI